MISRVKVIVILSATLLPMSAAQVHAAALAPDRIPAAIGSFLGEDGGASKDLSGIACPLENAGVKKRCLIVDDETSIVQFSDLDDKSFSAGKSIVLFGDSPPADVVGAAPAANGCKKNDDFKDLDGEGITLDGPTTAYVVGSHGCGRNKDKFRESSFLLMKIESVGTSPAVTGTFRLSEIFAKSPKLKPYFTKLLSENGLNIEGIAAIDGTLYLGLRAPMVDDMTMLVTVSAKDIFDRTLKTVNHREIPLFLGPNTGIRDLAALSDGRLVVLAGPTQEEQLPYRVFLTHPSDGSTRQLAILEEVKNGDEVAKAEGITVLGVIDGELKIAILFDGMASGGLRIYSMSIDPPQ